MCENIETRPNERWCWILPIEDAVCHELLECLKCWLEITIIQYSHLIVFLDIFFFFILSHPFQLSINYTQIFLYKLYLMYGTLTTFGSNFCGWVLLEVYLEIHICLCIFKEFMFRSILLFRNWLYILENILYFFIISKWVYHFFQRYTNHIKCVKNDALCIKNDQLLIVLLLNGEPGVFFLLY